MALQHLLYCESQVTRVRAARLARDRQAADSAAEAAVEKAGPRGKAKATKGEASDDEDDIAAQVTLPAHATQVEHPWWEQGVCPWDGSLPKLPPTMRATTPAETLGASWESQCAA